eukprot:6160203-Alexandrium_andersonii.AAC.1
MAHGPRPRRNSDTTETAVTCSMAHGSWPWPMDPDTQERREATVCKLCAAGARIVLQSAR